MPLIRSANTNLVTEIVVRIVLFSIFCYLETLTPFTRFIQPGDLHSSLKYPPHESYVPGHTLWVLVLLVPLVLVVAAWGWHGDCNDALEIFLAWSMALSLTGIITDSLKLTVGRPRPDFFYRCFPDGQEVPGLQCTGDPAVISAGRQSFPSGHASLSWSSLGMLGLWMRGRMGRGVGAGALLPPLLPWLLAAGVAISRTCDYHHHWEDVVVGSILGLLVSLVCYRQHYNPLTSELAGVPYVVSDVSVARSVNGKLDSPIREAETSPLLMGRKEDKWI